MDVSKEQMTKLDGHVQAIDKKVSSILTILSGNKLDADDKGMIGDLSKLSTRVDRLEKFKDRMIYLLIGMGIPAGYGVTEIIQYLLSK